MSLATIRINQHPRGLFYLFLTELWERFSYYGITALLILYIHQEFAASEQESYLIYGAYATLVYVTSIVGGWGADRFLGSFRATAYGAIFIALGHFVMVAQDEGHQLFYLGLGFIIVGTGLFKPNVANLVSHLYRGYPQLRESGFTYAHIGCNIGTILAPIICAYIATLFSYQWAFAVAGFGMLIGIYTLYKGKVYLPQDVLINVTPVSKWLSTFAFLLLVFAIQRLFFHLEFVSLTLGIAVSLTIVLMNKSYRACAEDEKAKMVESSLLLLFYIIFMVLLQLSGGALNMFTDHYIDRRAFDTDIPTGAFQAVEPLAVVFLGIVFARIWKLKSAPDHSANYAIYFALSLLLQGFAFLTLLVGLMIEGEGGKLSMVWINLCYLFQAIGELFIAPIGLSMLSSTIAPRFQGLYMGAWILSSAVANFFASRLGLFVARMQDGVDRSIFSYAPLFKAMVFLSLGGAFVLFFKSYVVASKNRRKTFHHTGEIL